MFIIYRISTTFNYKTGATVAVQEQAEEHLESDRTLVVKASNREIESKRQAEIKLINEINPFKVQNFQIIDEEQEIKENKDDDLMTFAQYR